MNNHVYTICSVCDKPGQYQVFRETECDAFTYSYHNIFHNSLAIEHTNDAVAVS